MMQTIAIDWSGRERGAAETIWFARVRDGALVELENGMERGEVIDTRDRGRPTRAADRRRPRLRVRVSRVVRGAARMGRRSRDLGCDARRCRSAAGSVRAAVLGPAGDSRPDPRPSAARDGGRRARDTEERLPDRRSRRGGNGVAARHAAPRRPRRRRARDLAVRRPAPADGGRDLPARAHRARSSRAAIAPGASTSRDALPTRTRSCANARPAPRTRSTPRCRRS